MRHKVFGKSTLGFSLRSVLKLSFQRAERSCLKDLTAEAEEIHAESQSPSIKFLDLGEYCLRVSGELHF